MDRPYDFDWLIVGSGFGGSVSALRLAQKGYRVGVLECGRRYDDHDFAKSLWDLPRSMWLPRAGLHGTMRISMFKDVAVLSGSGVGGGSLVYSNVHYRPDPKFFDGPEWPGEVDWQEELESRYDAAEQMLGVAEYPHEAHADALMHEVAADLGVASSYKKPPVAVFMGEPGVTVDDPYFDGAGPPRTGCTLCGECMVGCRVGAKNTLVKNYLWFAERLGVQVMPEREVTDIKPLGASADGSEGYEVEFTRPGGMLQRSRQHLRARGVIVATGTLGTNKLLQRCRMNGSLGGGISQVFATTVGALYHVSFDIAGNYAGAPVTKHMDAKVAGVTLPNAAIVSNHYTFDVTGKSATNMGWESRGFDFIATESTTRISFASTITGNAGMALDNVEVTLAAAPDPKFQV